MPSAEAATSSVSSLGVRRIPQTAFSFPIHPLMDKLLYEDRGHPDKLFTPPKRFSMLYPLEESFTKKWEVPSVDAAVSCMNKNLTCPLDNAQVFKDPTDKKLETLLKASFSMAGAVVQPTVATVGFCQFLKEQVEPMLGLLPSEEVENYVDLPQVLCFMIDAILDSAQQASRLSILLVHMRRSLWLKSWAAELSCKRYLAGFPFKGERLFGDDLDNFIQKITGGKSTLLPVKRSKRPPFKQSLSPSPGTSGSKQWRRPSQSTFRGKAQGHTQGQKKAWGRKPAKQSPKTSL